MKFSIVFLSLLFCSCSSLNPFVENEKQEKIKDLQAKDEKKKDEPDYDKISEGYRQNSAQANQAIRTKQNHKIDNKPNILLGTSKKVDIDPKKVEALMKRARKGDAQSQYQLGLCYKYGYGVKYSSKSAEYWLKKAADQGHLQAKKVYFHFLRSPQR